MNLISHLLYTLSVSCREIIGQFLIIRNVFGGSGPDSKPHYLQFVDQPRFDAAIIRLSKEKRSRHFDVRLSLLLFMSKRMLQDMFAGIVRCGVSSMLLLLYVVVVW